MTATKISSRLALGMMLGALMIVSILSSISMTAQNAEALSAITFSNQSTFTSLNSGSWQRVWTNTAGTSTYFTDTLSGAYKSVKISSAGATQTTVTAGLVSDTMSAPTTNTGSSTRNNIIFLQALGGTTQALVTGSTTFITEYAATASSQLVGQTVNEAHLWLKKTCAGTCTGTATVAVFNSTGGTVYSFGTIDCNAGVTTSFAEYTFTGAGSGRTIANGDRIGIFFNGGSAGNTCDVEYVNADRYDGTTNTIVSTATGTQTTASWTSQTARELHLQLGFDYVAALSRDTNTATYWENQGQIIRAVQSDDGSSNSIRSPSNTISFAAATDGVDRRVWKSLGFTASDTTWSMNFDYLYTTSNLPCHQAVALTAGSNNPSTSSQDMIAVMPQLATDICTGDPNGSFGTGLTLGYKDGAGALTILASTGGVTTAASTTYYCILERLSSTSVKLSVFTDSGRTVPASGSPVTYTIPATVTGLTTYQSSVVSTGGAVRSLTADIDNVLLTSGSDIFNENFASPTGWTQVGTLVTISSSTGTSIVAEKAAASSTLILTNSYDTLEVRLKKTGTPSATITAAVFASDGSVVSTFNTMSASSLTTSYVTYSFQSATAISIASGQYVGISISGGDLLNTVEVAFTASNPYDGTNSVFSAFGSAWTDTSGSDVTFRLYQSITGSAHQEASAFIKADFGSAQSVGAMRVYWFDSTKIPASVTLSTSTDDITYTPRATWSPTQSVGYEILELLDSYSVRYVKMTVATWGSANSMAVAEFQRLAVLTGTVLSPIESSGGVVSQFYAGTVSGTSKGIGRINVETGEIISASTFTASLATDYGCMTATKNKLYMSVPTGTGGSIRIDSTDRDYTNLATVTGVDHGSTSSPNAMACAIVTDGASGATDVTYWTVLMSTPTLYFFKLVGTGTLTEIATLSSSTTLIFENTRDSVIVRNTLSGTESTYTLSKSTDTLSSAAYTNDWITLNTQLFDFDGTTRTWKSSGVDYLATTSRAVSYSATGTLTDPYTLYIETANSGTGTLTGIDDSPFYRLSDTLVVSGSGTTWTPRVMSAVAVTPSPYSERLNVPLTLNNTVVYDGVFRMVCDASYTLPSAKIYVGSDSDCIHWTIVDVSSETVGRNVPYSRTASLVHALVFTGYAFQAESNDPNDLTLKSLYNGTLVDEAEFDSAAQLTQQYLYQQCYDVQVVVESTGATILFGNVCANDFFTKTLTLTTVTIPQDLVTTPYWNYSWSRDYTVPSNNTVTFNVIKRTTPFNASIYFANHYLDSAKTYERWFNYTNQNSMLSVTASGFTSNDTMFITVYENNRPAVNVQVSGDPEIPNFFASLGSLWGVPVPAIFAILVGGAFVKSNAYFGLIVTAATIGLMAAFGFFTVNAGYWGVMMVVLAFGVFAARRYF